MNSTPRRRRTWVWVLVAAFALIGGAAWALEAWRCRSDLDAALREMAQGRPGAARARLAALAARWPAWPEVHYQLGLCERALGRLDAAVAAWARVPPDSSRGAAAALLWAQVAMDHGRLAKAEAALTAVLRHPGPDAPEVRGLLIRLFRFEGRTEEVAELLRANWDRAADPAAPLHEHAMIDLGAWPLDGVRRILSQAARTAPDDDRVWLGLAHLVTRTGRFEEAARLLDRCQARRPDDPVVWRSRLDWALASGRAAEAMRALAHLRGEPLSEARFQELRAWFAAQDGDTRQEQAALERLVERQPGHTAALERLADLAVQAGQIERAVRLRHRKRALDAAIRRYRSILEREDYTARAAELAPLAEHLGRWFEARGWWALVACRHPDDRAARAALARLDRAQPLPLASARAVDELLADLGRTAAGSRPDALGPAPGGGGAPAFLDEAEAAGLRFVHRNGQSARCQLPATMSGGVGVLDYDGDGWLDVYCVQGGPFPPAPGLQPSAPTDRLFRNRGDGTFEDATESAGIAALARGYGHGVAVGDYDNDGDPDLFLTRWRAYALYRNRGDGTFEDVTAAAGLGGDRDWPTSAAFADLDGDGDLDLYVCHYLAWDRDHPKTCSQVGSGHDGRMCCAPSQFASLPDRLYRNDGGRFVEVTAAAGLTDRDGRGLGVLAADLDADGRTDLFVANDVSANFLFRNRGGLRFEEVGEIAGVAANAGGGYQAGMGIACGDLDGDGRLDLAVTNFYSESTTFFHNLGGGLFADHTAAVGLAAPTRYRLGFGLAFFDFDNNGSLDLIQTNGHVIDARPSYAYAMPTQLFAGGPEGRLTEVSDRAGPPWGVLRVGRGLAVGDLDNDGRPDALVLGQEAPLAYFHNRTPGGHFLVLRLEGTASNRDAIGAWVMVRAGDRCQVAQRFGGGSYQSASDPRLHFGLGPRTSVDQVEVRWPSGRIDRFRGLAADAGYLLREGDPAPRPLAGFPSRPR